MSELLARTISREQVRRLLAPASIAIIGVSERVGSAGRNAVQMLDRIGFQGEVHLVSRAPLTLDGRRAVTSIDMLPHGVDLAILALPEAAIVPAVESLAARHVGGIVCFAAGFAEMGAEGLAAQARLADLAYERDIAFAGPNCLGYTNLRDRVAATFLDVPLPEFARGAPKVDILCQSGGMAGVIQMALEAECIGFSYEITTGNEAVLSVEDYLPFLIENDESRVIVMLVETLRRPAAFLGHAAAARAAGKPIVLVHLGRSAKARAAAATHTGALAGDFAIAECFLRSRDVVVVGSLDEMVDTALLLAHSPRPCAGGIGIVTDSGGFKGHALDFCESIGLPVAAITRETQDRIRESLPSFVQVDNPVDVTAQAIFNRTLYSTSISALLNDEGVGAVLATAIAATPEMGMAAAMNIASGRVDNRKPLACAIMAGDRPIAPDLKPRLAEQGVAFFRSPERALRAMGHAQAYGESLTRPPWRSSGVAVPPASLPRSSGFLDEVEAKALLRSAGVSVPDGAKVATLDEAEAEAVRAGYPVALKIVSRTLTHKSDCGGVAIDLADPEALRGAWTEMQRRLKRADVVGAIDGFLVEHMQPRGLEIIVGARRDPHWGPTLMIGFGGIYAEIMRDLVLVPGDCETTEIEARIGRLRGSGLLSGARGGAPLDVRALAATAARIAALMAATPQIEEIDVNPVIVRAAGEGVVAVDALIRVRPSTSVAS